MVFLHIFPSASVMVVFVLLNLKTESHEKLQMRGGERKVICLSQLRWDEIITLPLWRSSEPKKKKKNSEILSHGQQLCTEINTEVGDVYREE